MGLGDALKDSRFKKTAKDLGFYMSERRNKVQVGMTARSGQIELVGCRAEVADAGTTGHVSAGRVIAGTVLAPGIGTVVGAMAKKHRRNVTLRLTDRHGATISVETQDVADAEWFASEFNQRYGAA